MARFRPKFQTKPFRYRPISVADIMPDDNAAGAMSSLANLVPNPSSENQWVCRPGAVFLPASDINTSSVFSKQLPTNAAQQNGGNIRIQIASSLLPTVPAGATKIVVQLHFGVGNISTSLMSCWVGPRGAGNPYNFDGTQVQLTFNGNNSVMSINGEFLLYSDGVSYTYDHTKDLIIAFEILNNNQFYQTGTGVTNVTTYFNPFAQGGLNPNDSSGATMPGDTFITYANTDIMVQNIWLVYSAGPFISAMKVIGNRVYGMIADRTHAGYDTPFVYDLITQQQVAVSGILTTNVPTSPPSSGAWQPPIIDNVGSKVVVAHPGFNGGGNGYFGWFDISTFASPAWHSGNTTTTALPAPPKAVRQYNNRIWYLVPGTPDVVYASDNTNFQNINNTGIAQLLTFGDDSPINAMQTLGLHNILGGITHALLIFKANNVYQVTGDFGINAGATTIGSLLSNSLNIAVGTQAPLSVVQTPRGVAFLSGDGIRIIDWDGKISDPIGEAGKGIVNPFTQALVPSRVAAACNGQSLRVTTQNNAILGQPYQEFVFDLELKKWHGPHTFPAAVIEPWVLSYITSPVGVSGLWQSDIIPNTQSQYSENGVALNWTYQTALIPNEDTTSELGMVETTIYVAGGVTPQQFTVTAMSAQGQVIDRTEVTPPVTGQSQLSLWGSFVWGRDAWGTFSQSFMNHVQIPWNIPLVFDRLQLSIQGQSSPTTVLGELRGMIEELDYTAVPG